VLVAGQAALNLEKPLAALNRWSLGDLRRNRLEGTGPAGGQEVFDQGPDFDSFQPPGLVQNPAFEVFVETEQSRHARRRPESSRIGRVVRQENGVKPLANVPQ
jgi:hypothetical protein